MCVYLYVCIYKLRFARRRPVQTVECRIKYFCDQHNRPFSSFFVNSSFSRNRSLHPGSLSLANLLFHSASLSSPSLLLTINYSFVTLGALIDFARAFIFSWNFRPHPRFVPLSLHLLSTPLCRRRVHIPPLLDSLRSIEFKIQISVEILSSRTNPPDYPGSSRPFVLSTIPCFHALQALAALSSFPSFLSPPLVVISFSFSPGIFPSRSPSSPPSRKEGRNWPFGHERPRRKAAGRASSPDRVGKDWGLCGIG